MPKLTDRLVTLTYGFISTPSTGWSTPAEQFDAAKNLGHDAAAEAESVERLSRSRREDLLKMHAYRDAIRRTAGAYVLFPGNESVSPYREFQRSSLASAPLC